MTSEDVYLTQASQLPETTRNRRWKIWKGSGPWNPSSKHIDTAQSYSTCKGSPCGRRQLRLASVSWLGWNTATVPGMQALLPPAVASLRGRLRRLAQHQRCACADLDCFSELPPGASQELRDWADESGQLIELADRLKRLQILQRQLRFSDATGEAHQCCYPSVPRACMPCGISWRTTLPKKGSESMLR